MTRGIPVTPNPTPADGSPRATSGARSPSVTPTGTDSNRDSDEDREPVLDGDLDRDLDYDPDAQEDDSVVTTTPEGRKGDYVDSSRRGFDPALRPYRLAVYVTFGAGLVWFCAGLLFSVIDYLF